MAAAIYANPAKSGAVATSTNAANSATISMSGLAAGTYYLRVYGSAAYTYTITLTPPGPVVPAAPTGLTASKSTYIDGVHLSWTASSGATGYNVFRNSSNTTTGATQVNASSVATTTYIDTTAVAGTTYYYFIVATNTAGTSSYSSSDYGVCAAYAAPAAPTGVSGTTTYTDGVHLSWSATTLANGYQVWRNTSNSTTGATKLTTTDITTTTYDDTSATAGTTYYYFIVADNAAGSSADSAGASGVRSSAIQEVKPNNTYSLAQNLGTLTGSTLVDGTLASSSDIGWYEFTISSAGTSGDNVVVGFTAPRGRWRRRFTPIRPRAGRSPRAPTRPTAPRSASAAWPPGRITSASTATPPMPTRSRSRLDKTASPQRRRGHRAGIPSGRRRSASKTHRSCGTPKSSWGWAKRLDTPKADLGVPPFSYSDLLPCLDRPGSRFRVGVKLFRAEVQILRPTLGYHHNAICHVRLE